MKCKELVSGRKARFGLAILLLALIAVMLRHGPRFGESSLVGLAFMDVGDDYSTELPSVKLGSSKHLTATQEDTSLEEMAREAMEDGTVTLVYASYSYRRLLFNWLVSLRRNKATNKPVTRGLVLVCLDDAMVHLVRALGWQCYEKAIARSVSDNSEFGEAATNLDKDTVKTLWVARVNHLRRLLGAGMNVILTDTDAIWLKDLRPQLVPYEAGDIIASRARFPYDNPWGATLCMGFIFFRATPQVLALSRIARRETIIAQDDQVGFNKALYPLTFEDTRHNRMAFGDRLRAAGNETAQATFYLHPSKHNNSTALRLALLGHSTVARYCHVVTEEEWKTTVAVAHCHVRDGLRSTTSRHKGNSDTHAAIMDRYHLVFLKPDWETIVDQFAKTNRGKNVADEVGFDKIIGSIEALPSTT